MSGSHGVKDDSGSSWEFWVALGLFVLGSIAPEPDGFWMEAVYVVIFSAGYALALIAVFRTRGVMRMVAVVLAFFWSVLVVAAIAHADQWWWWRVAAESS